MVIKIKNKFMLKKWFEKNFRKLGYSKIIKKDDGTFPYFIMLKNNKNTTIELETLSSNFILHKNDLTKVDEIVCIRKDIDLGIPTIEVKELDYRGKKRISATIDKKTLNTIKILLRKGKYRNSSHVIESAIELLKEVEDDRKK